MFCDLSYTCVHEEFVVSEHQELKAKAEYISRYYCCTENCLLKDLTLKEAAAIVECCILELVGLTRKQKKDYLR
jgi:hypothetical protein